MDNLTKIAEKAGAVFQVGVVATGVAVVTGGAVAAQDLGEFPQNFINDDGEVETVVVVGDDAKTMDTVGAVNIIASLSDAASEHSSAEIDGLNPDQSIDDIALYSASNVDEDMMDTDMILVGGPSVNQLTEQLADNGDTPGQDSLNENEAVIQLVEDAFEDEQNALIVAGHTSDATMDAANFLSQYYDNEEELKGETKIRINTSEKDTDQVNQLLAEH